MIPDIAVLIVDDHAIVREGLRTVLQKHPSVHVKGDVGGGAEACDAAMRLLPDVVIMDLSMAGMSGTEATRRIVAASPKSRVIALTAHDEVPYVRDVLSAGARGYVLKRGVLAHLFDAIEVVVAGGVFIDPDLAVRQGPNAPPLEVVASARELTVREIEVASLTARGYSNGEIGNALNISVKTVETHKSRLMAKLGVRTRAQLVRYATCRGWV